LESFFLFLPKMSSGTGEEEKLEWKCKEYPNGDRYKGFYRGGKRHGHGTYKYGNGDVYEGQYEGGLPHGHGKFSFHDGNSYEGEFIEGNIEGVGRFSAAAGDDGTTGKFDSYLGEFEDDMYNGYGCAEYADGDRYSGEHEDDRRDGYGMYCYANGTRYEGQYSNGLHHGWGVFHLQSGDKYVGHFEQGMLIAHVICWLSDGHPLLVLCSAVVSAGAAPDRILCSALFLEVLW
jgi:hypothetical protein